MKRFVSFAVSCAVVTVAFAPGVQAMVPSDGITVPGVTKCADIASNTTRPHTAYGAPCSESGSGISTIPGIGTGYLTPGVVSGAGGSVSSPILTPDSPGDPHRSATPIRPGPGSTASGSMTPGNDAGMGCC
jgi:hypothetical protein